MMIDLDIGSIYVLLIVIHIICSGVLQSMETNWFFIAVLDSHMVHPLVSSHPFLYFLNAIIVFANQFREAG